MTTHVKLLGAIARPPETDEHGTRLVIAGTETVNIRGRTRTVPFYIRTLTPRDPNLPPGTPVYAEGHLTSKARGTQHPTRVTVHLTQLHEVPGLPTRQDAGGGHVLTTGLNHVTLHARLMQDIHVRLLPDSDREVMNSIIATDTSNGLLEICAYGLTARVLQGARKGMQLEASGRVLNEKRMSGGGRERTYTKIELVSYSVWS